MMAILDFQVLPFPLYIYIYIGNVTKEKYNIKNKIQYIYLAKYVTFNYKNE